MTSDTGAVARIVDGLREIVERWERLAKAPEAGEQADEFSEFAAVARECLAVAEAQR